MTEWKEEEDKCTAAMEQLLKKQFPEVISTDVLLSFSLFIFRIIFNCYSSLLLLLQNLILCLLKSPSKPKYDSLFIINSYFVKELF